MILPSIVSSLYHGVSSFQGLVMHRMFYCCGKIEFDFFEECFRPFIQKSRCRNAFILSTRSKIIDNYHIKN